MSVATRPMTVAEFLNLPDPGSGFKYELRDGEPILVPPAKWRHYRIQKNLVRLLDHVLQTYGQAGTELAFRPLPEHHFWYADVAVLPHRRWSQIEDDRNVEGTPEIVIEVESPSNTAAELEEKETICLKTGAVEFWTVYPTLGKVKVATRDGAKRYVRGECIPLSVLPGASIDVSAIFSK